MDDGDIDFTNPDTYLPPAAMGAAPQDSCSMSMGSYFDDILKDTEHLACTHTHACCNLHLHHDLAHTNILPAESDDVAEASESPQESNGPTKRPAGNLAAVRKYREKKKARTALLEEEVARLKALNRQLVRKIQSHSALEAEASRLRCLLVDIRGRIEGELGAFPFQRPVKKKNNDLADHGSFLGGAQAQQVRLRGNDDPVYCSPEMQATTVDDDGVMSGELLGQGATNQWPGCAKFGSAKAPGHDGGLGTPMTSRGLPDDVER